MINKLTVFLKRYPANQFQCEHIFPAHTMKSGQDERCRSRNAAGSPFCSTHLINDALDEERAKQARIFRSEV